MSALQFLDCIDIPSRSALNKNKKILNFKSYKIWIYLYLQY